MHSMRFLYHVRHEPGISAESDHLEMKSAPFDHRPHDERLVGELSEGEIMTFGERAIHRQSHAEPVTIKIMKRDGFALCKRGNDNTHIERPVPQCRDLRCGCRLPQFEPHIGQRDPKGSDRVREPAIERASDIAEPNEAGLSGRCFPGSPDRIIGLSQRLASVPQEGHPGGCQTQNAISPALNQVDTKVFFELSDRDGQGRLGHAEPVGGAVKMPFLRHRDELFHLAKVDHAASTGHRIIRYISHIESSLKRYWTYRTGLIIFPAMEDDMMNEPDFKGQCVLITGAGRGLGLAYARVIGQLGATVLLHDIGANSDGGGSDPSVAETAARELCDQGIDAHPFHTAIDTRDGCRDLVNNCLDMRDRLDAVIQNAGWVAYEQIEDIQEPSFDHMMAVMTKAPLWIAQAAWPGMCEAGYGRIVLNTSCRALFPQYVQKGLASYAAAKMATVGIVNVLADEGAEHGIVVNAVSPVAKTRMWGIDGEPEDLKPREVAPGVAFLASNACTEGGWILRAANGQFQATRAVEAEGVDYPRDLKAVRAETVSEVAGAWDRIARPTREARQ